MYFIPETTPRSTNPQKVYTFIFMLFNGATLIMALELGVEEH
jgi:hypothetical protein